MISISSDELARWRGEIEIGLEFQEKEFGTYRKRVGNKTPQTSLAGRNLDYFEQGGRTDLAIEPPLNIVFPIVKNIVPTLFFKNPRATAVPDSRQGIDSDDAFYASELINRDLKDTDFRFKETGQGIVFDAYVLGFGVVKIGYATEFGADILPTKKEDRKKLRDRIKGQVDQLLEQSGLKEPKPDEIEPEKVHPDTTIRSEKPYLTYISPFDFVIDYNARDITNARWVAQRIRRTIKEIKEDRRYSSARHKIYSEALDDDRVPETAVEDFQTADVWEVHYKDPNSETGITTLTFAATQSENHALMHEHNVYDLGGWQYEWLVLNKHGHRLYPISTISVIRPLIDRINSSLDAVLEQVDKFVTKIAYNDDVTPDGERALDTPAIGTRVKIKGDADVRKSIAVISMEQVKADMLALINQIIDMVILITGLTRAQLTGLTTAQTATEAQIGQSGQNLRRTDEANTVADFTNRLVTKIWRVKSQFQALDDIDLVQESAVPNSQTNISETQFYPPIKPERAQRLKQARFKFTIEVSSIQKPNLEIIRAQFEQFMKALMQPVVTNGLALEGKRVSASEALRQWARFFEEAGLQDMAKMIVPADPQMLQALLGFGQKPTTGQGGGPNGQQPKVAASAPNRANLISKAAGERGQGVSPA